jgi:hypothetical protein
MGQIGLLSFSLLALFPNRAGRLSMQHRARAKSSQACNAGPVPNFLMFAYLKIERKAPDMQHTRTSTHSLSCYTKVLRVAAALVNDTLEVVKTACSMLTLWYTSTQDRTGPSRRLLELICLPSSATSP